MVHHGPPGPVLISKRLVVIRSTNIKNVNYWLYGRATIVVAMPDFAGFSQQTFAGLFLALQICATPQKRFRLGRMRGFPRKPSCQKIRKQICMH